MLFRSNMSYEFFGQVYKAIKQAINSKEKFYNELELFETTKKFCRHIPKLSYSNFVVCLWTFLEIGVIKFAHIEQFKLIVDESQKTKLDNSKFYNSIRFLTKIA